MPTPRVAAAVMLTRGSGDRLEVYLVERAPELRFFGGYWAMPGGVVDPVDRENGADEDAAFAWCALRELFEETGVLAGGLGDGRETGARGAVRTALIEDRAAPDVQGWREWIRTRPAAADDVRTVCNLTTPEFQPLRYRTRFLHVDLPTGEQPEVVPGELLQGRWFTPHQVLEGWQNGDLLVVPPVLFLLGRLAGRTLEHFREDVAGHCVALDRGQLHEVYFSPGIFMAPLLTPTVPPATSTNCLLVGTDQVYVVDPASPHPDEQARLFDHMQAWIDAGRHFEAVLVTHHHPDHVGAVDATARRFDLPVRAHPRTLERLSGDFRREAPLQDGDVLELGRTPDGRDGWQMTAYHTPGHDQGHLAFHENRYGSLIAGDLVSTLSTIVIDPPEGHLATYLASLRRMQELGVGMIYPSHGAPHRDGPGVLRYYLEHRQQREDRLVEVLGQGPATEEELLAQVYEDTAEEQWPYAARSLRAGLDKLAEEGRGRSVGEKWELLPSRNSE